MISARSIGSCNVQVVLEPLGGGGNAATAGRADQERSTVQRRAATSWSQSIDKFYEDLSHDPGP